METVQDQIHQFPSSVASYDSFAGSRRTSGQRISRKAGQGRKGRSNMESEMMTWVDLDYRDHVSVSLLLEDWTRLTPCKQAI